MTATYVQDGKFIDYAHESAVTAGSILVVGGLLLFAVRDAPAGELAGYCINGVFDITKDEGTDTDLSFGDDAFWDAANGWVGADAASGDNLLAGTVIADAGVDDTTVRVRVNQ